MEPGDSGYPGKLGEPKTRRPKRDRTLKGPCLLEIELRGPPHQRIKDPTYAQNRLRSGGSGHVSRRGQGGSRRQTPRSGNEAGRCEPPSRTSSLVHELGRCEPILVHGLGRCEPCLVHELGRCEPSLVDELG